MSNPKITQLGTLSATGQGVPRVGVQGDHTFTATVSGAGAVSATVAVLGSNDLVGWVTLATLTLTGTALATASSAVAASHAYWRADVTALSAGATVQVLAASEEAAGGGSGLSATELTQLRAVVSEAWMSPALQALIGAHPTRIYHDDEPLLIDAEPIFHTPD